MPTAASMQARFPEVFASTSSAVLDAAIAEAARLHDAGRLGALYEDAVLYYAAHLATLGPRGAQAGVSSAAAGGVSVTFSGDGGNDAQSSAFLAAYRNVLRRRSLGMAVSKLARGAL